MNRESNQRREHGPERRGGQGLDPHQYDSGDATILALLAETPAADFVDLVITWRSNENAYEVWSRRGMIRFKRLCRRPRRAVVRSGRANWRKPNR